MVSDQSSEKCQKAESGAIFMVQGRRPRMTIHVK
jgi:hypothetical protein